MKKLFSKTFLPVALVCFLTLGFFIPFLIKGKIPIPADDLLGLYHPWRDTSVGGYNAGRFPAKNPLITDPILQTYPWKVQVINNFKSFRWPLWNPYNFSGQPLLANLQSAPFSIFNLLFFILPFKFAWAAEIILSSIISSIFMYLYLKNLKLEAYSAIFGGVVLPFTGFFVAWLTWGNIITTALWLPLVLLSIDKVFVSSNRIWLLALIFSLTQTIFSGHLQTSLYIYFVSFFYIIYRSFAVKNFKIIFTCLICLALSILIAAPQILPSLEFSSLSARNSDQGYFPARQDWFIPIHQLVQIIAPDFFGNPTTNNYWGVWNYGEFVSFAGLVPLAFALLAILKKKPQGSFFVGILVISVILAIKNPISLTPYSLGIPIISSMQPSRIIFLIVFSISALSAIGLDLFLKTKSNIKLFIPVALIGAPLIGLAVSTVFFKDWYASVNGINSLTVARNNLIIPLITLAAVTLLFFLRSIGFKKYHLLAFIFILTITELFRFAYKFTPFSELSWIYPETQTTQFLERENQPYRLLNLDRRIFNASSPSVYQIETVQGYDPLFLKDYAQLVSSWQAEKLVKAQSFNRIVTPDNYSLPLASFLNIKYVAAFDDLPTTSFKKVFQEGETKIYENKNALPRAFFTKKVSKLNNNEEILTKVVGKNFNPIEESFSQDYSFESTNLVGKANFEKYTSQSFLLKTTAEAKTPLIVSNIFYPGWKAYVDGNQVVIQKVNYLFQSIIVPSGEHLVEFKYEPQSFYNGLGLSFLGIILTIISFITWRKKFL